MLETYTKPSNVSNSYTHLYSNPNINSFNVEGSKIRIQDTYADRKNANGNSFRNIDQTNIYRMLNNKTNLNGGYRGIFGSERKIKWSKDQCNNNIKFKDERDCNTDNKSIYANNKQNTDEQPHISRFNSNLGVNEDYGYDMDSNYKNVGNRRSDKRRRQRITLDNYIQQQQWCKTQNMKSMRNPHFISQQEYYN